MIFIGIVFAVLVIYSMILFCVTSSFSLFDFSLIILLSDNFECGFYPILMSMLKYKLNYWILTIYFMIFEQELILVLLLTFCIKTFNENIILCFLLGLLFLDLLFNSAFNWIRSSNLSIHMEYLFLLFWWRYFINCINRSWIGLIWPPHRIALIEFFFCDCYRIWFRN